MTEFKSIKTKLAVIGFDVQLDGLADIDQVEAALYRGEVHRGEVFNAAVSLQQHDSSVDLCRVSAECVLQVNKLICSDAAVIMITDKKQICLPQSYFSTHSVCCLADALQLSEQIISEHNLPVLIQASNLPSHPHSQAEFAQDKATISFAQDFEAYGSSRGVSSVLLASESFAAAHNSYVYASINSLVSSRTLSDAENVIKRSFADCAVNSADISTVEVSASADCELRDIEQQALLSAYRCDKTLNTSISCAKSVLGENGLLSELLSLINTVFALQQRYRPAVKEWTAPRSELLENWMDSPFYLFNQAAPVFPNAHNSPRYAALSCVNKNSYTHIIAQENSDQQVHHNGFNASSAQSLFIAAADSKADLLKQLSELTLETDLKTLAKSLYQKYAAKPDSVYKVVLIAESSEELAKELSLALKGVADAFAKQGDWKTPKGSYFSSQPQSGGNVAFLYPGIGATYIGLGRDLFHLFPEIYPSVIALAANIGASLKDQLLNPRSVTALDFKQLKQRDLALRNELANIAECGVGYACVFTKIFEQVFAVNADYASGYSMGEISMFAALGCWHSPGLMSARLAASDTFNHRLSGELRAIRELWDLPDVSDGTFEQIWETYSIKGTLAQVNDAIAAGERVYVTIINTPDSLVIGGYPDDCLKVIKRLGVRAMPLNMANAIHSAPAHAEYQNMLDLYSMDVTERINSKMISSSCYLPIPQHKKAIAVSIAKCLCDPVDFPRLINTLAAKGVSVFIEMGAGRSLCSWTDKILKENPDAVEHLSVPVNAKGTDDQLTYARAAAKLLSFGVKINLDSFFYGSIIQPLKD
ncbi:PfaB family protein [Psychromonas aquimarina]|uniref:PfaB family protein n=1 Tax=Psychromonas aquimarina TaxID=444919 RepID=UPI00041A6737|nr:PfaB family protein [Psychromonas aquimarina]